MTKAGKTPWHFITPDEFKALLTATPTLPTRAFYATMYACGLRFGEAVNLLWNGRDIDFERGRININNCSSAPMIPPFLLKDHECRSILMPQWLSSMLTELQAEAAEGCPFSFINSNRWAIVATRSETLRRAGKGGNWQTAT